MAKRMTDTEKWDKKWFRTLPAKMKLMWMYLCDSCDFAGVWSEDLELASFKIGEEITQEDYERYFGSRKQRLDDDKVFLPGFIEFQYSEGLSEACAPHRAVLRELRRRGIDPTPFLKRDEPTLTQGLGKGSVTTKDKDKDTDKEKGKEKGTEKGKGSGDALREEAESPLRVAINACLPEYVATLKHFNIGRAPDVPGLGRAIQEVRRRKLKELSELGMTSAAEIEKHASFQRAGELVRMALIGARHEKPVGDGRNRFEPSEYFSLERITRAKNLEALSGLGAKEASRPGIGQNAAKVAAAAARELLEALPGEEKKLSPLAAEVASRWTGGLEAIYEARRDRGAERLGEDLAIYAQVVLEADASLEHSERRNSA